MDTDFEFRLLIVAGSQTDISASHEFLTLSRLVRTQIVSGVVTYDMLFNTCLRDGPFDGLYILGENQLATPKASDRIMLSDTTYLEQHQIAGLVQASPHLRLLFLNACDTARVGTYVIQNTDLEAVIYTTEIILDKSAWEVPERFFRAVVTQGRSGKVVDFRAAYIEAISPQRNGEYSIITLKPILVEIDFLGEFRSIKALLAQIRQDILEEIAPIDIPHSGHWLAAIGIYSATIIAFVLMVIALARMLLIIP